jgi:hypothetical protein
MMVEAVHSGVRGAMKLTGAMLGSAGRGARDRREGYSSYWRRDRG